MKKIGVLLGFCMVVAFLPTFMPQPTYAMTGSGTAGDPYVIYNVTDLQNVSLDLDAYYILGDDIDASATSGWNGGAGFVPIGDGGAPFTGHFDGNNSRIYDLYINRGSNNQGLFGAISAATIHNVELRDLSVTASGMMYTGGLVGNVLYALTAANISQCMVFGAVSGKTAVGVLVGLVNSNLVTISECATYGSAYGTNNVGGLIGGTGGAYYPTIINCYSRAQVTGWGAWPYVTQDIGGLIGSLGGTTHPTNCYSTGLVSCGGWSVTHCNGFVGQVGTSAYCTACFWDTQTSGKNTGECGTGKTTVEMKTQSTYTDASWDFTSIWEMGGYVNDGYPYFQWWYNPPDIIQDVNQVVWFQPNAIIEGVILPNRAQSGTLQDGEFTWGANPAGVTITHGELVPEEEYDFEPVIPSSQDIIKPEPTTMIGDVDTERLHNNPLYPLVQVLSIGGFLNERLVWLGLAWFILIAAMFGVHLGFDTHRGSDRPQHFVLTTIVGLGFSILFYMMGIFPWWVILVMALGLVGSIIWERQPVL